MEVFRAVEAGPSSAAQDRTKASAALARLRSATVCQAYRHGVPRGLFDAASTRQPGYQIKVHNQAEKLTIVASYGT